MAEKDEIKEIPTSNVTDEDLEWFGSAILQEEDEDEDEGETSSGQAQLTSHIDNIVKTLPEQAQLTSHIDNIVKTLPEQAQLTSHIDNIVKTLPETKEDLIPEPKIYKGYVKDLVKRIQDAEKKSFPTVQEKEYNVNKEQMKKAQVLTYIEAQELRPVKERVTFYLYCADMSVKINCPHSEQLVTQMVCLQNNIHMAEIEIDVNNLPDGLLTYSYEGRNNSGFFPRSTTTEGETRSLDLRKVFIVRDFWLVLNEENSISKQGLKAHLFNIFQRCTADKNTYETTFQIFHLFQRYKEHLRRFRDKDIMECIHFIQGNFKNKNYNFCFLALLTFVEHVNLNNYLKQENANSLLESVKGFQHSAVFWNIYVRLPELLYNVCTIVYSKSKMCLMLLVKHTCHLFDAKTFLALVEDTEKPFYKSGALSASENADIIQTLTEKGTFRPELTRFLLSFTKKMEFFELQSMAKLSHTRYKNQAVVKIFLLNCENKIDESRPISSLVTFLTKIEHCFYKDLEPYVVKTISSIIDPNFASSNPTFTREDSASLQMLCLRYFELNAENQKMIIERLIHHQDPCFSLVPKLLKKVSFAKDNELCKRLAQDWMKERLKHSKGNLSAIENVYDGLEQICLLSSLDKKDCELIDKETSSLLSTFSFGDLIKFTLETNQGCHIFKEHVKKYVKDQVKQSTFEELKATASMLFEKDYKNEIDGFKGIILSSLIAGMEPLSRNSPVHTVVMNVLANKGFWYAILKSNGDGVGIIKGDKVFKNIKQCFEGLLDVLVKGKFSYKFAMKLSEKEERSALVNLWRLFTDSNNYRNKDKMDAIIKANNRMRDLEARLQNMTKILADTLGSFPLDFQEVYVNAFRHILQYAKIKLLDLTEEVLEEKYIFQYETLDLFSEDLFIRQSYKRLKPLLRSKIFWEVNRTYWERKDAITFPIKSESKTSVDNLKQTVENLKQTHNCFEELCQKYISKYVLHWQPILSRSAVRVIDVRCWCDITSVDKEIETIAQFEEAGHFADADKEVIRNFLKFPLCKAKLDILFKAVGLFGIQPFSPFGGMQFINTCLTRLSIAIDRDDMVIWDLSDDLIQINNISSKITNEDEELLYSISESGNLLTFLCKVKSEEIRSLVESVEEYSEQLVRETTIAALIDSEKFLRPFLKKDWKEEKKDTKAILDLLLERKHYVPDISAKIDECNANIYSLQALYDKHKDRELRTVEIMERILIYGHVCFLYGKLPCCMYVEIEEDVLKPLKPTINLKKKSLVDKDTCMRHFSEPELLDLRNRALLLLNTSKAREVQTSKSFDSHEGNDYIQKFIDLIDTSFGVFDLYTELHRQGHYLYSCKDSLKKCDIRNVEDVKNDLDSTLKSWVQCVKNSRKKHYYLNFVHPLQIGILYRYFFHNENKDDVDAILQYIETGVDTDGVQVEIYHNAYEDIEYRGLNEKDRYHFEVLEIIAKKLNRYCECKQPKRNILLGQRTNICKSNEYEIQSPVLIVKLKENSKQGINTMMALYMEKRGEFPSSNQVIICSAETDWNDIKLLIRRCNKIPDTKTQNKKLYCIVNADVLSSQVLQKLSKTANSMTGNSHNSLAVVFRGKDTHPFIETHFDSVQQMRYLSLSEMRECVAKGWPTVLFVTSECPGLGKTEFIKEQSFKTQNTSVLKTVNISGMANKANILKSLKRLKISESTMLHINIGMVDKPEELDLFLFELITFKCARYRETSIFLPTNHIAIEVANTGNDSLVNSLTLLANFKRVVLEWKGYSSLEVSQDINSPIQIVCHYLRDLKSNQIDTKDLSFKQTDKNKPVDKGECQNLLDEYFPGDKFMSFTTVNIFVSVFAEQLKHMTLSEYFKSYRIEELQVHSPVKRTPIIRSSTVKAMLESTKIFSCKCVASSKSTQAETELQLSVPCKEEPSDDTSMVKAENRQMLDSLDMISWEDLNHVLVVFHRGQGTLSLLYKTLQNEPAYIKTVKRFIEHHKQSSEKPLSEYSQDELKHILLSIACPHELSKNEVEEMMEYYALTPDNILKFSLILFRIHAQIPVVLIGDTGCGKTSLIKKLATICKVEIHVLNINAGVKEHEIIERIAHVNDIAKAHLKDKKKIWLFIDEINTSNCIGLLSDIVCHHVCNELQLAPNVCIFAACNPYRYRKNAYTAGLLQKTRKFDKFSNLVYRVNPLPESLLTYVWDFGTLGKTDEQKYIARMLQVCMKSFQTKHLLQLFIELVTCSQIFVREKELTEYSVSLRDVERCRHLLCWFLETYFVKKCDFESCNEEFEIKGIILTLYLCYYIRFQSEEIRNDYMSLLEHHFKQSDKTLISIVEEEQNDIINRMEIPKGIAVNKTLIENIYVMMICALNCIPLFVVGKPGCSKTLSLQMLRSNLRGSDSKNSFFKKLPCLYCVTYQGSQSSTSEGIAKAYKKAETYQTEHNKDSCQIGNGKDRVLALLLLDEIGQTERSVNNPLKVLHSLFIQKDKTCSILADIAVIGISNWALDAAKMNRAIHLSRPEMDETELKSIAVSIHMSLTSPESKQSQNMIAPEFITQLVKAYLEFIDGSKVKEFHGLRDFYSLVKCISQNIGRDIKQSVFHFIKEGILRNFSGLHPELSGLNVFAKYVHEDVMKENVSITELIKHNIEDENSRHLMLITSGDAGHVRMERLLKDIKRDDYQTFIGSSFQNDDTQDYYYRILSEIILCMETGKVVILKNLQNIYGNLYDMLNKSYCVVGGKQHCRIALGPDNFPMCCVDRFFKCIVIVNEDEVENLDPPLLNRFEKQRLCLQECLSYDQRDVLSKLEKCLDKILTMNTTGEKTHYQQIMPMYGRDTLSSLVMRVSYGTPELPVSNYCRDVCIRDHLLFLFHPEVAITLRSSKLAIKNPPMIENILEEYFEKKIHEGLKSFLVSSNLQQNTVIFTHSSINVNLQECLRGLKISEQNISNVLSETQLKRIVHRYFHTDNNDFLIVRFPSPLSITMFKSAKLAIEKETCKNRQNDTIKKPIIYLVHLDRGSDLNLVNKFDFLSILRSVSIDSLTAPFTTLPDMFGKSVIEILDKSVHYFFKTENMYWAFTRLCYVGYKKGSFPMDRIQQLIDVLIQIKPDLWQYIKTWLKGKPRYCSSDWLLDLARQTNLKKPGGSFMSIIEKYLIDSIREPLVVLIYQLEKKQALQFLISNQRKKNIELWCSLLHKQTLIHSDMFVTPSCPGCYYIQFSDNEFKIPFGAYIIEKVEDLKTYYLSQIAHKQQRDILHFDFVAKLNREVEELNYLQYTTDIEIDYLSDFVKYFSSLNFKNLSNESAMNVVIWVRELFTYIKPTNFIEYVAHLHTTFWVHYNVVSAVLNLINLAATFEGDEILNILRTVDNVGSKGLDESYSDEYTKILASNLNDKIDGNVRLKIDVLVKTVIKNVIAASNDKLDLNCWRQVAHNILSISEQLNRDLPCIFSLQFCLEMTITIDDNGLAHSCLNKVRNLLHQNDDALQITSEKVLSDVLHIIFSEIVDKAKCAKLLSLYVTKCVVLNHQSQKTLLFMEKVIKEMLSLFEDGRYIGSMLHCYIFNCTEQLSVFEDLLFKKNTPTDLFAASTFLNKLLLDKTESTPLALKLVDILEHYIFRRIEFNLEDSEIILSRVATAINIYNKKSCDFQKCASVAYLKSFISIFAENLEVFNAKPLFAMKVNNILSNSQQPGHFNELHVYFLQCLENGNGILNLEQECKSNSLQMCRQFELDDKVRMDLLKLFIQNFPGLENYRKCEDLLGNMHTREDEISEIAESGNPFDMLGIAAFCFWNYYLKQIYSSLTENDHQNRKTCYNSLNKSKTPDNLSLRVLGILTLEENTYNNLLQISEDTCSLKVHLYAFTMFFLCSIMCNKDSFWNKIIINPEQINLPKSFQTCTEDEVCWFGHNCYFSQRCVWKDETTETVCPQCNEKGFKQNLTSSRNAEVNFDEIVLLLCDTGKCELQSVISPLLHNILELFVSVSMLSSLALEYTSKQDIIRFMKLDKSNLEEDLLAHIDTKWDIIGDSLAVGYSELFFILTAVVDECKNILFNVDITHEEYEKRPWAICLQEQVHKTINTVHFKSHGVELDENTDTALDVRNIKLLLEMPTLSSEENAIACFRKTVPPSFDILRTQLFLSGDNSDFPFLQSVLENYFHLKAVKYLKDLVTWHIATVNLCNFKLRKADARTKFCDYLVNFESQRTHFEYEFDLFKTAWNNLVTLSRKNKDLNMALKPVSDNSFLEDCFIMNDSSPLKKVIEKLVSIQNEFLDQSLRTCASSTCKTLDFFGQGSNFAFVPVTSLIEITRNKGANLIQFESIEKLCVWSENGTSLGCGRLLTFDFSKIEFELARDVLFSKTYLLSANQSLPRIQLKDVVFENTMELLDDVNKLVTQEKLPTEIEENIRSKIINREELLTHSEVLLAYIRHTGGHKEVNCNLVQFMLDRKHVFGKNRYEHLLQTEKTALKLCHVVALYKLLEELNGENVIEEKELKKVLTANSEQKLRNLPTAITKVFLTALRTYAYRCLNTDDKNIEQNIQLNKTICLGDKKHWPDGAMKDDKICAEEETMDVHEVLDSDLYVRSVAVIHSLLVDSLKDQKSNFSSSKRRPAFPGYKSQVLEGSRKQLTTKRKGRF